MKSGSLSAAKEIIKGRTDSTNSRVEKLSSFEGCNETSLWYHKKECVKSNEVYKDLYDSDEFNSDECYDDYSSCDSTISQDSDTTDLIVPQTDVQKQSCTSESYNTYVPGAHKRHDWVYFFKSFDPLQERFSRNNLVVIRGNSKKICDMDIVKLCCIPTTEIKEIIKSVQIIQRNPVCQMYVMQGLQNSLHFSLGKAGAMKLCQFCTNRNIPINYIRNDSSETIESSNILPHKNNTDVQSLLTYVHNPVNGKPSDLESEYIKLMTDMGNEIWPILFKVRNQHKQIYYTKQLL